MLYPEELRITDEIMRGVLTAAYENRLLSEHAWCPPRRPHALYPPAWGAEPITFWVALPGMNAREDLTTTVRTANAAGWAQRQGWIEPADGHTAGPDTASAWVLQSLTDLGEVTLADLMADLQDGGR